MRHPKRFCADCDEKVYLTIRQYKGVGVYHCRKCGAEVSRMGDGENAHTDKLVAGGIDVRGFGDEAMGGNVVDMACEHPELLSDEHAIWKPRDKEAEDGRREYVKAFTAAYRGLTIRQREVVEAVEKCGSQEAAAAVMGVNQSTIARTIKSIRKKLDVSMHNSDKSGQI